MENTKYQDTTRQAEGLVNGPVPMDRQNRIRRKEQQPMSMDGIVKNLYSLKDAVRIQTYTGKALPVQLYMRVCYAMKLKDPRAELDKKRRLLVQDDAMLEEDKTQYRADMERLDAEIKGKLGWVYDSDKMLDDLEKERDQITNELGNEKQDMATCENLSTEAGQDGVELKGIARGCQADSMLKAARLNELEEEIADISTSLNEFYDEKDFLEAEKINYRSAIQALTDTQNQSRYLARMYSMMIKQSGPDAIATGEKLGLAQARISITAPELEQLQTITEKYFTNIRNFHKTVPDVMAKHKDKVKDQKLELAQISVNQVQKANERRKNLHMGL
jgi:septal ring factor EnvC (AmiA/AmiB activator)